MSSIINEMKFRFLSEIGYYDFLKSKSSDLIDNNY
jgi:hypothetical protein